MMEAENYSTKILEGLNQLRIQKLLCDYTLEAEGESYQIHKAVMVSCSDYFKAMLTGIMKESTGDRAKLYGVTAAGLKAIIEFAYTGRLDITLDNLEDILSAASHLQVTEAIDLCSRFMACSITAENCIDVLNMTEIYSLACMTDIRHFILVIFEYLSETDQLNQLSHKQMASLLSENGLKVTSEYYLFEIVMKWINHDPQQREQYLAELVKQLRLPLLSGEELVEKVSGVALMRENKECSELLSQAKDYHIVVGKQPLLQNSRTQVRSEDQSLVLCHTENLECYNLKTRKHAMLKDSPVPLYNPCVCVVGNFMYCLGGKYDNNENNDIATARCFRYDPRFDSWFELGSMNEARKDFGAVAFNDTLYTIAGQDENTIMCTVECFSIVKNEWDQCKSLPHPVFAHAVAICNKTVYVSGGQRPEGHCSSVTSYNLATDEWTHEPPMLSARSYHSMECVKEKIFVLGGNVEDPYNFPVPITSVECYDPQTKAWTICKATLNIREAGTTVYEEQIYIAGGINGQHYYSDLIQLYDEAADVVRHVEKFPSRIYGKACGILTLPQDI